MGRLFLIDYDQTPDTKFYVCRNCRTHITLARDLLFSASLGNEGFFEMAINLLVDGPEHYRTVRPIIKADVNCNKCLGCLGWKYIVDENQPTDVEEGFVLSMDMLLLWDGEQLVDAKLD